jgi:hypothetical protein
MREAAEGNRLRYVECGWWLRRLGFEGAESRKVRGAGKASVL